MAGLWGVAFVAGAVARVLGSDDGLPDVIGLAQALTLFGGWADRWR